MRCIKRIVSCFCIFLLILCSFNSVVFAEYGWDGTTEVACLLGSGEPNDPYLIATPEELAWFRSQVKIDHLICAKLTADIDLNDKPWIPIGGDSEQPETSLALTELSLVYSGVFDGNGFTIKGLNINISADSNNYRYLGLFGAVMGEYDNETETPNYAEIKNLTVKGSITIESNNQAPADIAGICGCGSYLKVSNCTSDVSITINGDNAGYYIGGIIGYAVYPVIISDCVNMGSINGNVHTIGGVLGCGRVESTLVRCCNLGSISGNSKVGGLAGVITGEVKDCYNAGNVTAVSDTSSSAGSGGLIGRCPSSDVITISNCFTTGVFSSDQAKYSGAVYGYLPTKAVRVTFSDVFYLEGICSRAFGTSAKDYGPISMTSEEISSDGFVTTLNTNSGSTVFKKGSTHPIFVWQTEDVPTPVVILGDIDGNGSVTAVDVTKLLVLIEKNEPPEIEVGDINGDGSVTAVDVTKLLTLVAPE